jgi:hypothetical protein
MRANKRVGSIDIVGEATEFPMHRLLIGAVLCDVNGVSESTQSAQVFEQLFALFVSRF